MKVNKKKTYERPLMQVVQLKQTAPLLTLSGPGDYGDGGDPMSSPELLPLVEDQGILFE